MKQDVLQKSNLRGFRGVGEVSVFTVTVWHEEVNYKTHGQMEGKLQRQSNKRLRQSAFPFHVKLK